MVIISTSAIEVSIQAVSPEFGVQSFSTAFFGSGLPAQAGGPASAAGAAAASSAYDVVGVNIDTLRKMPSSIPNTRANSPARVGFLNVMILNSCRETFCGAGSEGSSIGFAGADAHGAVEAEDKDLSIPDLTGLGGGSDGIDGLVDLIGCHRDLDFDLRQEAHRIFGAAIDLGVTLLPPVSLDLRHGHPVHADRGQSVADLVELERLDDGHDDFHGFNPHLGPLPADAG